MQFRLGTVTPPNRLATEPATEDIILTVASLESVRNRFLLRFATLSSLPVVFRVVRLFVVFVIVIIIITVITAATAAVVGDGFRRTDVVRPFCFRQCR